MKWTILAAALAGCAQRALSPDPRPFYDACLTRWKLSPDRCQAMWLDIRMTVPVPPPPAARVEIRNTSFYQVGSDGGDPAEAALWRLATEPLPEDP